LTDIFHHFFSSGTGVRHLPLVFVVMLLGACSTSPQGRSRITTPTLVGKVYSAVDMHIQLASTISVTNPCSGEECSLNDDFDRQVQQLGARLAQSAFSIYPDLVERISQFEFVVAEKDELGSSSNASGTIIIFRGEQKHNPDEKVLAMLIAREMGHVVARHHDENAAPRMMLSLLAAVLFPAINIVRASTPTSYIGSKLILAGLKPGQLREADAIAMKLLEGLGWNKRNSLIVLGSPTKIDAVDSWSKPSPSLL
jgi:predicted Zn-dependent protease